MSREDLGSLFEAARWAPSCFNDQPWSFVVGVKGANDDGDAWRKVFEALVPANQTWAERAPVLAVSIAREAFAHDGKPNRWAPYDTGAAAFALTLQAQALGLHVHQMGGFDAEKIRASFGVGADHQPMAAIAIGYATGAHVLPEKLAEREVAPRTRRELDGTFFGGTFGEAHPVVR
ncbi:MAG: nitroreductase family protein [Planctomycetota bacterium]